jgi:hypothetical protein
VASTSATGGAPSKRSAQEVIEMYVALGLPVCDDWALIESKIKAQRDRYLRDKNKPDRDAAAAAVRWFRNADALERSRPELLRAVAEQFVALARPSIGSALAQGIRTLTPQLVQQLKEIARTSCKTDDALAERFVREFMASERLELNKALVLPALVEDLKAESLAGAIHLSWRLPAANCEEVEVVREAEDRPGLLETVHRGKGTAFRDAAARPGVFHTYRVHSFHQGVRSEAAASARAVNLGEVRDASAVYEDGALRVRWKPAGPAASTLLFRRREAPPSLRLGAHGPEPADADTALVQRGGVLGWDEPNAAEGATYHYRLIADFGAGLWSRGVDVHASVPAPPPAVPRARASYRRDGDRDAVAVEWDAVPGNLPVEHVVVRRGGSAPPSRPEEGQVVATTRQHACLDASVAAGQRYTYAVFSRLGGLLSKSAASAGPVDALAEVSTLKAEGASGAVELTFTAPANVSSVIVRRSLAEPRDHRDGALVRLSGPGHAKDDGLRNGQRYHYLVCCGYRPEGADEVFSPGVRVAAVPDELPDAVGSFEARAEGADVVCTWTPPQHGLVVVVRSSRPHGLSLGARIPAEQVDRLGARIPSGEGRAVDAQPDVAQPHYSAFTIAGSQAAVGASAACAVAPDVSDLRLTAVKEGVILRWAWPKDTALVRIVRRADAWPDGPDDPRAHAIAVSRTEYQAAGSKHVDAIDKGRARLHYVVYAQPAGAPGVFFSAGTSAGCRQVIQWEPWMTLRYRLEAADKPPHKGSALRLVWSSERAFADFSGFVLVASHAGVPASPDDGIELFRWTPQPRRADGEHDAFVSLEPVRRKRWARFFAKAFVVDAAQRPISLVIHPDTARPRLPDTGEAQQDKGDAEVRRFRAGVPKSVVCPECFDEFPLEKMLFSSFEGGEPVPGRYSLLDKLRGQPLLPPTNNKGQRLTQKHCPNQKHVLPFTAGAQASLVIGLIGAKFSGKSHYIASLVKRIEGQVGGDLQASLLPVSDETQIRYKQDFHDPLFGKGLELSATLAGTPKPLIYDLTIDGALWKEKRNRAVTLALYDTAGENLDSRDTVQQMLRYLRVASGIMFLVDPLQAPAVRDALPSHIPIPNLDATAEPNVILSRVLQVLENGRVVAQAGSLATPVAVVLTKCDVLREANLLEPNRLWSTDHRHVGYFDREAHADMSGMMAEYVQRYCPAAYNTVTQRFARHAFFGASATGCASDQATRRYKYISPWRVEDPLLWLLSELGVIPAQ